MGKSEALRLWVQLIQDLTLDPEDFCFIWGVHGVRTLNCLIIWFTLYVTEGTILLGMTGAKCRREWYCYFVALALEFDLVNDKKPRIPLIKSTSNYKKKTRNIFSNQLEIFHVLPKLELEKHYLGEA